VSIELLRFIPLSGDFRERTYDAIGTCTWVLFSPPADEQWVGVFGNGGVVHHSDAALSTAGGLAFVVAGGQGYAVKFPSGDLLFKTECCWLTGVLALPGTPYVLACDFTGLHSFNAAGEVWTSGRVALDGIRLLSANDREASVAAWYFDGWYEVTVQFEPFSVQRRSLLSVKWDAYSES
jgi:hypothetical protein